MNFNEQPEEIALTEEEQKIQDGRLGLGEAIAYQKLATDLDGGEFTEKAREISYEEAEKALKPLMDEKFDFLGIGWSNFNFTSRTEIKDAEERISNVTENLLDELKRNNPESYKNLLKEFGLGEQKDKKVNFGDLRLYVLVPLLIGATGLLGATALSLGGDVLFGPALGGYSAKMIIDGVKEVKEAMNNKTEDDIRHDLKSRILDGDK